MRNWDTITSQNFHLKYTGLNIYAQLDMEKDRLPNLQLEERWDRLEFIKGRGKYWERGQCEVEKTMVICLLVDVQAL